MELSKDMQKAETPEFTENPVAPATTEAQECIESPKTQEKIESPELPESPKSNLNSNKKKTTKGKKFIAIYVLVNICRFVVALTFLFSAFVKANDPVGFSIKLQDYALAIGMTDTPKFLTSMITMIMVAVESTLGIYLLVGVKRRKRIAALAMLFMAVMTGITIWLVVANPVSDCGCFGDAIKLTNGQSLMKNIILLAMTLLMVFKNKMMFRLIHKNWNWLITIPVVTAMVVFTSYSEYMLPTVDFLPFAENTDLRKTVAIGNGLDMRFKTTIVYKRGDEILELTEDDDDPDSSWTYVETKSELLNDNLEATTQFFVIDKDGDDVTEEIIGRDGYSFIVTVPEFEKILEPIGGKFNEIYKYCEKFDYGFYFITGTTEEETWERWVRNTAAKYPPYESDERILWQIVRDNPGLLLMKDGVVVKKWSQFAFPFFNYSKPLEQTEMKELIKTKRYAVKPLDFTDESN